MEKKHITYSRDEYTGCANIEIGLLEMELSNTYKKIISLNSEIEKIQSNCLHEYKFVCSGMYQDNYSCCLCGHESER